MTTYSVFQSIVVHPIRNTIEWADSIIGVYNYGFTPYNCYICTIATFGWNNVTHHILISTHSNDYLPLLAVQTTLLTL